MVGAAAQRLFPEGRLIAHVTDLDCRGAGDRGSARHARRHHAVRTGAALGRHARARRHPGAPRRRLPADRGEDLHQGEGLPRHRRRHPDLGAARRGPRPSRAPSSPTSTTSSSIPAAATTAASSPTSTSRRRSCRCRSRFRNGSTRRSAISPDRCRTSPSARNARDPFECEFMAFCAPDAAEYPVALLPHGAQARAATARRRLSPTCATFPSTA